LASDNEMGKAIVMQSACTYIPRPLYTLLQKLTFWEEPNATVKRLGAVRPIRPLMDAPLLIYRLNSLRHVLKLSSVPFYAKFIDWFADLANICACRLHRVLPVSRICLLCPYTQCLKNTQVSLSVHKTCVKGNKTYILLQLYYRVYMPQISKIG